MRSVIDRNVVMRRIPVNNLLITTLRNCTRSIVQLATRFGDPRKWNVLVILPEAGPLRVETC